MPKTGYPDPTTSRTPSHRRRPRSAPAALAALVALALAVAVPAPAAAGPPGPPGSLVSVAPTTVRLTPTIPLPGRAWAVTYRSSSATGAPIVVSGTVLLPAGAWFGHGPRPLVTYAVGTHGLGDQCAPSRRLAEGTEAELLLINQALGRGWAVAVTDYEGLGTPGPHTYLVAPAQGNAVLDMARAALALPDAGPSPDAPVGIWGFSRAGCRRPRRPSAPTTTPPTSTCARWPRAACRPTSPRSSPRSATAPGAPACSSH